MKRRSSRTGMRKLLRPKLGSILFLSALTVLQSLLLVTMAVVTRFVIDAALSANGKLLLCGVMLAVNILALIAVHALLAWCSSSAIDKFTVRLRRDLLSSAAYSRDVRLNDYHSGALLSRGMEDVHTVCDGAMNAFPSLVGQITSLIATFVVVLIMYPPVALVMSGVAVLIGAVAAWLRPAIKRRHRGVREAEEKVMADMQEDLQQLELIQGLGIQKPVLQRFAVRQKMSLLAKVKRRLWSVGSNSVISAASQLGTGVLLLWGAAQVALGSLSYGSLTSLIQLLSLFRGPVLGLSGLWARLAAVEVAGERLAELLELPEQEKEEEAPLSVSEVVFENVTFAYPSDETPVLQDFSIRFPLDDWACLTGISGRGKSTLFKLILGLYAPQCGRVYLQTDRGEIPCSESTRSLFAYVPQDYALLSGSVLENLQLVAPEADHEKIRNALHIAGADFVWELTAREQTQVRENTGLSKGQLQRIAIARAVLMERPVFLLDECTSALDAQTEKTVLQNLRSLGKKAILVTHRPEALDDLGTVHPVSMET